MLYLALLIVRLSLKLTSLYVGAAITEVTCLDMHRVMGRHDIHYLAITGKLLLYC